MKSFYKLTILLFSIFVMACNGDAQESAKTVELSEKIIDPNQMTWKADINEALAEAKNRGELLFVECFSPTCPHCQALEPYFKMPEVASMYNKNFINYKLDVTKNGERFFLDDKKIWLPSFPMFLFFDGDGNLVHQSSADPSIEMLNGIAETALNPDTRTESYAKRFADGERSLQFLSDFAAYNKVVQDTLAGIEAANALFEIYPKDQLGTEESWKLTKNTVSDIDNGFAKYWFQHTAEAGAFEASAGVPNGHFNVLGGILQFSLYSPRGSEYSYAKLQQLKKNMTLIGAAEHADNNFWELEIKALIRENKLPEALAIGRKMINNYQGNVSAHIYITRIFNDFYPDNSYGATAKSWLLNDAQNITQDNIWAEYYYELARINQKLGETDLAKQNATLAKDFAVKINNPSGKYEELLDAL